MTAAVLTGHGGFDKLEVRTDYPVPTPGPDEVLIRVLASAVNNTDINSRIGWYSKTVTTGTESGGSTGFADLTDEDAAWSGSALGFPRIQGADACGVIVAVGERADTTRVGERVLVRNMLRSYVENRPYECWTLGSECDGGFAQFLVAPAAESYRIDSDWSDAALASIPCAYSTAENMLHRADVGADRVVIAGASGGVGLAAVQLAKRRGAHVIAIASTSKWDAVREAGADEVLDRGTDIVAALGEQSVDVVLDLVGGEQMRDLLAVLRRGGAYAVAGAIGGPIVELDLRTIYLNDLRLLGCTFQEDEVFENLIGYIERDEIRPIVSATYDVADIEAAQKAFLSKMLVGKIVLLPPADDAESDEATATSTK
ncbi:alcohol dehydrogenase [Pseudoclavibacter sp. RFBA6]|nr:alcohol dehydrogenase [Pseudoclavibacter sp. RFBA6]